MSSDPKQAKKNEQFLFHLKQFGLLSAVGYEFLQAKTADNDETALIFNLSEYLQARNASEFYDISRRMYDAWASPEFLQDAHPESPGRIEELKDTNAIKDHKAAGLEAGDSEQYGKIKQNGTHRQTSGHTSNGTNRQADPDYESYHNRAEEQVLHNPIPEKYPTRPEVMTRHPLTDKELQQKVEEDLMLLNLGFIMLHKILLRRALKKLRATAIKAPSHHQTGSWGIVQPIAGPSHQGQPNNNFDRNNDERGRSQQRKGRTKSGEHGSPTLQTEHMNSDSEFHGSTWDKLYEEKFFQEQNRRMRQELYELNRMKECTFSPKINPKERPQREQQSEDSKKSVFDRLTTYKVPKAVTIHRSHEARELDGATFSPQIKKSQSTVVHPTETDQIHERRARAAERLYQDAELKQKVLKMKQEYIKEQELKECTFTPQIVSPKSLKGRSRERDKSSRSPAVERLYQDSLVRKQIHLMKVAEKEQAQSQQYTFKPQLITKGYKGTERSNSINKSVEVLPSQMTEGSPKQMQDMKKSLNDSSRQGDPFERLYSFAKKKQEVMLSREEDMMVRDSSRNPNIRNPRDKSNTSMRESRMSRSRSAQSHAGSQAHFGLKVRSEQDSEQESRFLERLAESNAKRKEKIHQLQEKVMKEQGITFKPKTLLHRIGAHSTKSKADDRSVDNMYVASNQSMLDARGSAINRTHDGHKLLNSSSITEYRPQTSPTSSEVFSPKWISRKKQH